MFGENGLLEKHLRSRWATKLKNFNQIKDGQTAMLDSISLEAFSMILNKNFLKMRLSV